MTEFIPETQSTSIYKYQGNQMRTEPIENSETNEFKIISIISEMKYFIQYCNCDTINIYDVKFIEEFNNDEGVYDNICYHFEFIWNNRENTYFLNDIPNNNYETNIIGNINSETSTKQNNTYFLEGDRFIKYVFDKPLTFKKLVDDCF